MNQVPTSRIRFKEGGQIYRVVSVDGNFVTYRQPYNKEPRDFSTVNIRYIQFI